MQIFVVYDAAGNIVSTAVAAVPGQAALLAAGEGHRVLEVDASDIRRPGDRADAGPEFVELSGRLIAHYRVEGGKLTPRGT